MMWRAWQMDGFTYAWLAWIAAFIIIETWAVNTGYRGTLTAHLRPVFLTVPWLYWAGVGLYVALGIHIFLPPLERWLLDAVGRGTP